MLILRFYIGIKKGHNVEIFKWGFIAIQFYISIKYNISVKRKVIKMFKIIIFFVIIAIIMNIKNDEDKKK